MIKKLILILTFLFIPFGKADENKDNSLDIKELSNYIIKEVKEQAALSGRE